MIPNLLRPLPSRAALFGMAVALMFFCGIVDLLAQDSWRELPMPSMYLQAWGRPDIKGTTWVVPQDSGIVGVSTSSGSMIMHRRVDPGARKLTHAAVIDERHAVVAGRDGAVFRTKDGGQSWSSVAWSSSSAIRAMCATPGGAVVIVDSSEMVYRSTDSGSTFVELAYTFPSVVDHIITSGLGDTLYAYGHLSPGYYISVDAGLTWNQKVSPSGVASEVPRDVAVMRDGTLAAIDRQGRVWFRFGSDAVWEQDRGLTDVLRFSERSWYKIAGTSRDSMLLVARTSAYDTVAGVYGLFKDVVLGDHSGWYEGMRTWFADANLWAIPQGVVAVGPYGATMLHWLAYQAGGGADFSMPITVFYEARGVAQQMVTLIEPTPRGTALVVGWALSQQPLSGMEDASISWIARYVDGRVERELVTHFVLDSAAILSYLGEGYSPASYSSRKQGILAFHGGNAMRIIYSEDDGQTWSTSSQCPSPSWLGETGSALYPWHDTGWLIGGAKMVERDSVRLMVFYISEDRGHSWDSILMPTPVWHSHWKYLPLSQYAPGRVLLRFDTVLLDVDIDRRFVRELRSPSVNPWAVAYGGARAVYSVFVPDSGLISVETYDMESMISREVVPYYPRSYNLRARFMDDSVAMMFGGDTLLVTTDAGSTWKRHGLPMITGTAARWCEMIGRIRPGVYMAFLRETTLERGRLIEFRPSWDPIPVSVESPSVSLASTALTIAPNPSTDGLVAVDVPEDMDGECSWSIVDMLGRVVAEGMADTMTGRRIMPGKILPAGGYTFMLQSRTGRRTARFVVQP